LTQYVVPLSDPAAADPERFGPKAANQAALGHAGLPIPDGFCLDAAAYRAQLESLGLTDAAHKAVTLDFMDSRQFLSEVRVALFEQPIAPQIQEPLVAAYRDLVARTGALVAVRSSSIMEDRAGTSFAGQFQSYLGIDNEADFLTTVRACWGALWSSRAMRYMEGQDLNPNDTAMGVLVQATVDARASGGGMSRTAGGGMSISATWGLGEAIAQGEVVPDRYDLTEEGELAETTMGRKDHSVHCHRHGPASRAVAHEHHGAPCLNETQARELGRMMRKAEKMMDLPVEVEWAMDEAGIKMLQARPLQLESAPVPDDIWSRHPGVRGHPGGVGWGAGRACVISCECELGRVGPGDVLVTRVAGPALAQVLPRVSGVVAELGGSTSHLASLARERGIPMVLGVLDATHKIPDGSQVGVDGVAGIVRWIS
jgi:pyruvate,water dikinase